LTGRGGIGKLFLQVTNILNRRKRWAFLVGCLAKKDKSKFVGTDIRTKEVGDTEEYINLRASYKVLSTMSGFQIPLIQEQMDGDVEIMFNADPNTVAGQDMIRLLVKTVIE
jgi:hypothetical protein